MSKGGVPVARQRSNSVRRLFEEGVVVSDRGVALDLDGVLIDGLPFHIEAWKAAFGEVGASVPERRFRLLEGVESMAVVEAVCAVEEIRLSVAQRQVVASRKKEIYRDLFRVVPLPGAVGLVELLRHYGYRIVIVTGTLRESADQALLQFGLAESVQDTVSSESVVTGKPHPQPYLEAIARLGVPGPNVIAVENAPAGVKSAKSAGIACLAIATYLEIDVLAAADKVFRSVADCRAWFEAEHGESSGNGNWRV